MADSFIEDSFIEGGVPPLPKPPTAADVLSKMSVPPVPNRDALSPANIIKAAGENLLPPGVGFKNGLPVLSGDSLKRGMSPVMGQYGLAAPMEKAGADVETAVDAATDSGRALEAIKNAPGAVRIPLAGAIKVGEFATDMVSPALRPSSVQQMVGAEAAGPAMNAPIPKIGMSLKDAAKKGIGKIGKAMSNVDEGATAQAFKNPEVMDNDYASPERIETVTRGLKKAVEDTRKIISGLYDNLKKKLDKGGKGKVNFNDVTEPLNEARKKLKVGESGLTKIDAAEEARIQQLGKEISQEIHNKVLKPIAEKRGYKLPNKPDKPLMKEIQKALDEGKFNAEDMLEIRKRISREIDFEGTTDLYKKELLTLRGKIDDAIRHKYPKIKELDAKTSGVKKTEAMLRRKAGIVAGRELNEVNVQKVERLSKSLFDQDKAVIRKVIEEAANKLGADDIADLMKNIGASKQFDTGRHSLMSRVKNIDLTGVGKGLFKTTIRSSKAASRNIGKNLKFIGPSISGAVKDREK